MCPGDNFEGMVRLNYLHTWNKTSKVFQINPSVFRTRWEISKFDFPADVKGRKWEDSVVRSQKSVELGGELAQATVNFPYKDLTKIAPNMGK